MVLAGASIHGSGAFDLMEATAEQTACGAGDSFCSGSIQDKFQPGFRSDRCSIQQSAADNTRQSNYYLWIPKYRKAPCKNNAYSLCGSETSRLGPRKVKQEGFLQGRGQVTAGRECFASGLRFLPEAEFESDVVAHRPEGSPSTWAEACQTDMTLYPHQTRLPKSCGSVSEIDITHRLRPLPGEYAGAFAPIFSDSRGLVPNITSQLQEGLTLSNKRYPAWGELKAKQNAYRR